jgi:hypothetical protein
MISTSTFAVSFCILIASIYSAIAIRDRPNMLYFMATLWCFAALGFGLGPRIVEWFNG